MSASINDKITETFNGQNPTSTTVSGSRAIGGTTLTCTSLAGWPIATAVHFATYRKDGTGAKVAGSQTDWKGIVSGSSINTLTRQGGAADGGNGVGDIVEMMPTYAWANDLAKGLENTVNADGTIRTGLTITTPTLTTPTIADFTQANHTHASIAQGGAVALTSLTNGTQAASVLTSETSATQTYGDNLATPGPSVTVTIGANGLAIVHIYVRQGSNSAASSRVLTGFVISGANTQASNDNMALDYQVYAANAANAGGATFLITGLSPGSTTFKMQYRVTGDTGSWSNRRIAVAPL